MLVTPPYCALLQDFGRNEIGVGGLGKVIMNEIKFKVKKSISDLMLKLTHHLLPQIKRLGRFLILLGRDSGRLLRDLL